jgi:hypothetical protein
MYLCFVAARQLLQRHPSEEKSQQTRPRTSSGTLALLLPHGPLGRLVGRTQGGYRAHGEDLVVHRLLGCYVGRLDAIGRIVRAVTVLILLRSEFYIGKFVGSRTKSAT